jgi:hypothetical protein
MGKIIRKVYKRYMRWIIHFCFLSCIITNQASAALLNVFYKSKSIDQNYLNNIPVEVQSKIVLKTFEVMLNEQPRVRLDFKLDILRNYESLRNVHIVLGMKNICDFFDVMKRYKALDFHHHMGISEIYTLPYQTRKIVLDKIYTAKNPLIVGNLSEQDYKLIKDVQFSDQIIVRVTPDNPHLYLLESVACCGCKFSLVGLFLLGFSFSAFKEGIIPSFMLMASGASIIAIADGIKWICRESSSEKKLWKIKNIALQQKVKLQ